jgi:hypothetical protein
MFDFKESFIEFKLKIREESTIFQILRRLEDLRQKIIELKRK